MTYINAAVDPAIADALATTKTFLLDNGLPVILGMAPVLIVLRMVKKFTKRVG